MAINYCTLASNTVDTFCGPRRALVFNRLVAELHPQIPTPQPTQTHGGNPQQIRNTAAIAQRIAQQQRPMFDIDDRDPLVYEQPFVTVKVELFGSEGIQTMDMASNVDIVTVTNLEFESGPEISVNISDFQLD